MVSDLMLPINIEFIPSTAAVPKKPAAVDPFRHESTTNSHNHYDRHPWGKDIIPNSKEFDALYAQANHQYMYHLWYTPELDPFMATEVLTVHKFDGEMTTALTDVIQQLLRSSIDSAIQSEQGRKLKLLIQSVIDKGQIRDSDRIFVRLGATSAKDSWAVNVLSAKPPPLKPDPEAIVRRLLTSGRVVGRMLSLNDKIWTQDPGEALIIQRWCPEIEIRAEFRTFCYRGRVTAISQDIFWEDHGWRREDLGGFVDAILSLWSQVKSHIPFDTCTMDVLMTKAAGASGPWKAKFIEFNGFGPHLNTGSDLFHWVRDADILYGKQEGVTIRFVDEDEGSTVDEQVKPTADDDVEEPLPDWLALEKKIRATYGQDESGEKPLNMDPNVKLPFRGRWCSSY